MSIGLTSLGRFLNNPDGSENERTKNVRSIFTAVSFLACRVC